MTAARNGEHADRNRIWIAILFLAAAALLLVSFAFTYRVGQDALRATHTQAHQRFVIQHLDQLTATMTEAETGQRGYLITGEEAYLAPYREAVGQIQGELEDLHRLVKSGDLSGEDVKQAERLTKEKLAELEKTIEARRTRGLDAALAIVRTGQGRKLMIELRKQTAGMRRIEEGEFDQATREAEQATATRTATFALTALANVIFLGWVYRRITREMRRREEAVQETERQRELLATTLASIGDGVIVTDVAARITFINRVGEALTGWSAEEAIGWPVTEILKLINADTRAPLDSPVHMALRSGVVAGLTDRAMLVRKDGGEIPVDDSGAPIRGADGATRGVVLVFRDITERKRAEAALRESEERFRLLFQQAAVGIKRLSPEGRLLEVNDKQCEILGYPREELLQLSLPDITYPDDLPIEQAELTRLLAGEIPHYTIEKRARRKDGCLIWTRVTASLPSADPGKAPWWIAVVEDITERKRAEATLRETAEELARSNRDLEQFAYVASHDLQEPLRAVSGFVTLLKQRYHDQLDAKANEWIGNTVEGALRMQSLINDLLAYSRVGTRGGSFQSVEARSAVDAALHNLSASIQESGATVAADHLPRVWADLIQLVQLFQNLIGNAIKFRGERPPEIRIGARREGDAWLFWVRDNGIGIAPEYAERVFLIFQRLHTRSKYPGTGMGLAICKKIVERHGGRIWLESQPGEGTTFYFTLSDKGDNR